MSNTTQVDPITLSVIRGALETAQREMTVTMQRTGRSSVLTISRDFSNALFDATPEMIVQGQDLPIHLGSLILATKAVAKYFENDVRPGDIMFHNDPAYDGSHLADWCMYKPVFIDDEIAFWAVSKGHMADAGGPVPGSYNPDATDIYAEGLRVPPIKICDEGRERSDILNLLVTNTRTRRNQAGDLRAQQGAIHVAERSLRGLIDRYGATEIKLCVAELLNLAEREMRSRISALPDGVHKGGKLVEDVGHGLGDLAVEATITVKGDELTVALDAPPQIPYYTNSYRANTTSGVYLGLVMFLQPDPPYNEGMYRPITVDYGPLGTIVNAQEPAAHIACTVCPSETITDAVRDTLSLAYPDRAVAGWGHGSAVNVSGVDPRTETEYVHMMVSSLMCGAGAIGGSMDGWDAVGPQAGLGGATSGDMEIIEYHYPLLIHCYTFTPDSGNPGEWRGGSGMTHEVEAVDHEMTTVLWGEGRKYPASSVHGAGGQVVENHVASCEIRRSDGTCERITRNTVLQLMPGDRFVTHSPGGGAVGHPFDRDPARVLEDVRAGRVSVVGARRDYGVVIDDGTGAVDDDATGRTRATRVDLR